MRNDVLEFLSVLHTGGALIALHEKDPNRSILVLWLCARSAVTSNKQAPPCHHSPIILTGSLGADQVYLPRLCSFLLTLPTNEP